MIEINLAKKRANIQVAGIDITKVNWRLMFVAFLIYLIPDFFLVGEFEKEKNKVNSEITKIKKLAKGLVAEERRLKAIKDEIETFKRKTKELELRSKQVEKILKIKTNPNKMLEKVARSLPEDLWLKSIEVKGNRIIIIGYAVSYKSIGLFIEQMKESPFFDEKLTESNQKNIERTLDGIKVRLLEFTLSGPIIRYNPF